MAQNRLEEKRLKLEYFLAIKLKEKTDESLCEQGGWAINKVMEV